MNKNRCVCFLFLIAVVNCAHEGIPGGDCEYRDKSGYLIITGLDTRMRENTPYAYYWSKFITSSFSDTLYSCQITIDTLCMNNGVINLDTLYPCKWHKLVNGACTSGDIHLYSLPDSCYRSYPLACYDSLSKQERVFQ
jgi:hypothetical protein